jgi:hypothetical protein
MAVKLSLTSHIKTIVTIVIITNESVSIYSQIDVSKRVGYVATPMAGCCSQRQLKKGKKLAGNREPDDQPVNTSLKRVDLTGTSIDFKGLEWLIRECKSLVAVSVDDELW